MDTRRLLAYFVGLPLGVALIIAVILFGYGYYSHHKAEAIAAEALREEQARIGQREQEERAKLEREILETKKERDEFKRKQEQREQQAITDFQRREQEEALAR